MDTALALTTDMKIVLALVGLTMVLFVFQRVRADLVAHIRKVITRLGITQAEAAQRAGVSQPHMNDLVKGRTHKFTLDALMNVAVQLGYTVKLSVKKAA